MRGGSGLLAAVVALLWVGVHLLTQVATRPALDAGWTVVAGVALTTLVILGYPSALRGPRQRSRWPGRPTTGGGYRPSATAQGPRGRSASIAIMGRSIPLRGGLTVEAAARTVRLLRPLLSVDAVAIADRESILAFVGPASDHHRPGTPLATIASARVLETGRTMVIRNRRDIGCPQEDCPLRSGVIAPLVIGGERIIGLLKVYRVAEAPPPRDLAEGMAGILSLHLELAELDRERQLAADAKLDALRAQINPHFLFNTLNTIASKARTDADAARQLLLRLSDFFRYSIRQDGHFADFGQEYFYVRTYLELEQARFGDRLTVRYDVDPQVLGVQVPVLTIQPLVENAVKHGFAPKVGPGTVWLKGRVDPLTRTTIVQVRDDGVGMDAERLDAVLTGRTSDGGIGLRNISERLTTLFDDRFSLDVRSRPGEGTTVDLRVPLR